MVGQHEAVPGQAVRDELRRPLRQGLARQQRGDERPASPDRGGAQLVQSDHRAALPLIGLSLLGFRPRTSRVSVSVEILCRTAALGGGCSVGGPGRIAGECVVHLDTGGVGVQAVPVRFERRAFDHGVGVAQPVLRDRFKVAFGVPVHVEDLAALGVGVFGVLLKPHRPRLRCAAGGRRVRSPRSTLPPECEQPNAVSLLQLQNQLRYYIFSINVTVPAWSTMRFLAARNCENGRISATYSPAAGESPQGEPGSAGT